MSCPHHVMTLALRMALEGYRDLVEPNKPVRTGNTDLHISLINKCSYKLGEIDDENAGKYLSQLSRSKESKIG